MIEHVKFCSEHEMMTLIFTFPILQVLIDWINDVLVDERIIVKSLEDDLYDGQVLQKLLGKRKSHFPETKDVACVVKA